MTIDEAYVEAGRAMFSECETRGVAVFERAPFDANITAEALEIFGGYFHPLVAAIEAQPATTWPDVPTSASSPSRRRRRHFGQRVLASFPLTQPPFRCQRCGVVAWTALELDHMVELWDGGIDHPYNLLRLCSLCHRSKPLFDQLPSQAEKRLAVLAWAAAGRVRWW